MRLSVEMLALVAFALLLAGCAGAGEAAKGAETPVKVLDGTPTPGGPAGSEKVAGTPMAEDGTPVGPPGDEAETAPDPEQWQRHRFHNDWEFACPESWDVERPGQGNVLLAGELEDMNLFVEVSRVFDPSAVLPEEWVAGEITRLNGEGQGNLIVSDTEVGGHPAKRATGLMLDQVPGVDEGGYGINVACPA